MKTFPRSRWSGPTRPFHPFGRGSLVLLSALLLALPVPALAAPGDLAPSFDGDGKVLTDFRAFESVSDLAVQPDGKLVAVGSFVFDLVFGVALARYNPDGSLDRSFGGDGRVRPTTSARSWWRRDLRANHFLRPMSSWHVSTPTAASMRASAPVALYAPTSVLVVISRLRSSYSRMENW